ncbi:MAG: hypothetical protein GF350_15985 [Chitinivibrionales bacterium]|nr:hypothetical protein [Chitinivibrionales bacterium]
MSIVAEFAKELHEKEPPQPAGQVSPLDYPSKEEKLFDIRAVIFDVYGTLINYWRPGFTDKETKNRSLLEAFKKTVSYFDAGPYLEKMNSGHPVEITVRDLYHGLIALKHEQGKEKGVEYPEVKIENIWMIIIMMLKRYGYIPEERGLGNERQLAKCMAYYYNFHAIGGGLFPRVTECLQSLKRQNIILGILSNAQFYTPIDLTLLFRDQSQGEIDDYLELFDDDLCFFSYTDGIAKPGGHMFRKLFDVLYEYHVLPSQTVFAGNDLLLDIHPAQEAGMRTAFFTGDSNCAFVHDLGGRIVPDISFSPWDGLSSRISFHDKPGNVQ